MEIRRRQEEAITLHVAPQTKRLLDCAARMARQPLNDFVLQGALARAEEMLPDRRSFSLNAEQWTAFLAALDAPPRALPRLRRLLDEPSVFEMPEPQ